MRRDVVPAIRALARALAASALCAWTASAAAQDPMRLEAAVQAYAAEDVLAAPPADAIVFTGSSSIPHWKTLQADLAPLTVAGRGLSGSTLKDINHWLDQLVLKYRPRAVVLYEGDNDIGYYGMTPEAVLEDLKALVSRVHAALPGTRIYVLSIKPSVLRWDAWPAMKRANDLFRKFSETDWRLQYIDVASPMLDEAGRLKAHFYDPADGIHMNAAGYALWRSVIGGILRKSEGPFEPAARRAVPANVCEETVSALVRVDSGHPWRPPFGIERIGAAAIAHVEISGALVPQRSYSIVAYSRGREVERKRVDLRASGGGAASSRLASVRLDSFPDEIALAVDCASDRRSHEVLRHPVQRPEFEADAQAQPMRPNNPVDLGAILPPHDWLVLVNGQRALIKVAAISRARNVDNARLRVELAGAAPVERKVRLIRNKRWSMELDAPVHTVDERSVLQVSLHEGDRELWRKAIPTMIIARSPANPRFGAIETKLRYDASISLKDPGTGAFSALDYSRGWDPRLNDVVVFLPNGTRFVFWRGSSYVPFWAGSRNTGSSYQWAETITPPGFTDAVEPLQDKELRYGRVRIVESSASRVHVRWTYQSVDFEYRAIGDVAAEDFYFYPDGFGTRVLTLSSARPQDYVFSEFLILLPQDAYPLDILPVPYVDLLSLDGSKRRIEFPVRADEHEPMNIPFPAERAGAEHHPVERLIAQYLRYREAEGQAISPAFRDGLNQSMAKISYPRAPIVYRVRDHKEDAATPIYFNPEPSSNLLAFHGFRDQGELVTPAYWGDHWPLGRGSLTGGSISERIHSSPSHLALMDLSEPDPLIASELAMPDAGGRARSMSLQRRAWLIAKTDLSDAELLRWASSYATPPSLSVAGGRLDVPSYSPERRAIRLVAESPVVEVTLEPAAQLMNPVFEIADAPASLDGLAVDGRELAGHEYAWDGATLWLKASLGNEGATVRMRFSAAGAQRSR